MVSVKQIAEKRKEMLPNLKLLHFQGVGDQAQTVANPRGLSSIVLKGGWPALYAGFEPLYAQGIRRFILSVPFGLDAMRDIAYMVNGVRRPMQTNRLIDQFSKARAAGYEKICDSFSGETRKWLEAHPGCEIMAYVGTPLDHKEKLDANHLADRSACMIALDAELKPYFDARVSIGFDATSLTPASHWFWDYLQELRRGRGVKTYIETWPECGFEHLCGENAICQTEQLRNYGSGSIGYRTPQASSGYAGVINPDDLRGERQIWLVSQVGIVNGKFSAKATAEMYRRAIPALLANPWVDSVAAHLNLFLEGGGKIPELTPDWQSSVWPGVAA